MNREEAAAIYAKASLIDHRRSDDRQVVAATVLAWHEILADLTFEDANRALVIFRQEKPGVYLEPGYLVQISAPWRRDRARRQRAAAIDSPERLNRLAIEMQNRQRR